MQRIWLPHIISGRKDKENGRHIIKGSRGLATGQEPSILFDVLDIL